MKRLPASATDEQILQIARDWAEALAREDYEAAYNMTGHDPYYHWTPDLIRTVVRNYGGVEPLGDGSTCRVTPLDSAQGGPTPRHIVERRSGFARATGAQEVGSVWFDLPLDGEWSDLTVTFRIFREDDELHLVLNEIHVF